MVEFLCLWRSLWLLWGLYCFFLVGMPSIPPISKRFLVLEGSFRSLLADLTFSRLGSWRTPDRACVTIRGEFLTGDPSENPCSVRGGWLQPGGVLIKAGLVWLGILVSFDRVQRLDASLRGDSSRPSRLCLGYSQRVLEAGLVFDPLLGVPDSGTRGRPSNPSGGPVCAPLRFS